MDAVLTRPRPATAESAAPAEARRLLFWVPLSVIVLAAAAVRLYAVSMYPHRFNQDAAVLGYDGFSIWYTGRDHHGELMPIFFRTFEDFVPPVPNYLVAPFVGVFGLSEVTAAVPFALCGIATVALTGVLGRRWFSPAAGLIAATLLAFEPWHVNYSRLVHPGSAVPFFTVLALYCFTRAADQLANNRGSRRAATWFALSGLSFAGLVGTYMTLKLQGPLLFVCCLIALLWVAWRRRRPGLWAGVGIWSTAFVVAAAPMGLWQLLHWEQGQARYAGMSVFSEPGWKLLLPTNYAKHYDVSVVFFTNYIGGLGVHRHGIGELFWLEAVLLVAAVVGMVRARRDWSTLGFSVPVLALTWFLTFPVASSLTTLGVPHEIRTINLLPLPELLSGYGAVVLYTALSRRYLWQRVTAAHVAAALSIVVFVGFNVLFLTHYFSAKTLRAGYPGSIPYNLGLNEAVQESDRRAGPCDAVWFDQENQTHIYYAFYTAYPPADWQRDQREARRNGYYANDRHGQVHFGAPPDGPQTLPVRPNCDAASRRLFWVTRGQPDPAVQTAWREVWSGSATVEGQPPWRILAAAP